MRRLRVLVLHAYSADNAGDGLLVEETLKLIREATGDARVTMLASRPESFSHLDLDIYPTVPSWRGWDPRTRAILSRTDEFDLIVGVGGGYLRAGTPIELMKTALVMGPQLRAAKRTSTPTVYLPQSIGPARFGTRRFLRRTLRQIDTVMARDDRTMKELAGPTLRRMPDLATAAIAAGRRAGEQVGTRPVLSIRAVHKKINPSIYELAAALNPYDGYVQSTIGGNDDRPAMSTLTPMQTLTRAELMSEGVTPRVVVAVRLHAALMALAAGHYVVHLAYERKGFGAFDDLGLEQWVHPVGRFDPVVVAEQATRLLNDQSARDEYDDRIANSATRLAEAHDAIVDTLREASTPQRSAQ